MSLNLKLLRVQRGLTLEQLAQKTELTRSYLSKVERGLSSPSIDSAIKIAKALSVSVESLFGQENATESISIVRAAEGTNKDPSEYLSLVAGVNPARIMRAFVVRPSNKVGRGRAMTNHDGEELLYVLKGKIELQIGTRTEVLNVGDCVHFDSAVPHKLTSVGAVAASALVVISSNAETKLA